MLVRAAVSQLLRPLGLSTLNPLATKALYLASSNGPLTLTSRGPMISSLRPRQYMRRKVGQENMLLVLVSWLLNVKRLAPGAIGPNAPPRSKTSLKSHINSENFVPSEPR